MKTYLKLPVLGLALLSGALFIAGCNNAAPTTTEVADTSDANVVAVADDAKASARRDDAMGEMKPPTNATKLAFSSAPAAIPVGKPATWTLQITDAKSGDNINDFEIEMTKKMHLIVVKNDLSWFNHIHPEFKGDGKFVVTTALPTAGTYKLYADYTVKGIGQEIPQFEFATAGETVKAANVTLTPDKPQGMWLVNKFNSHPEGEPEETGGKPYEVALMPMPSPIVAGQDTMLHFQIRNDKGVPVKDLQPYLGAMGHCVILSNDTNLYLHSHPMGADGKMAGMDHSMGDMKMGDDKMGDMKMDAPKSADAKTGAIKLDKPMSGGPDVMFHTNFPKAGLYKVWGQFQHQNRIITAAFVVDVAATTGAQGEAAPHGGDEAKPHSH